MSDWAINMLALADSRQEIHTTKATIAQLEEQLERTRESEQRLIGGQSTIELAFSPLPEQGTNPLIDELLNSPVGSIV